MRSGRIFFLASRGVLVYSATLPGMDFHHASQWARRARSPAFIVSLWLVISQVGGISGAWAGPVFGAGWTAGTKVEVAVDDE